MAIWLNSNHEPGNEGERRILRWLVEQLPENYKLLSNVTLYIPGKGRESDIICLTPNMVFVIEVKDVSGMITIEDHDQWRSNDGHSWTSPLQQVRSYTAILLSKMRRYNAQLSHVYFQSLVCLAGKGEAPRLEKVNQDNSRIPIDLETDKNGYNIVTWYKDLPGLICQPARLYPNFHSLNIEHYHALLQQAVKENFVVPESVGPDRRYTVNGGAWFAESYRAYYAYDTQKKQPVLLKIYPVPESVANDEEKERDYVARFERESKALIETKGDTEGGKFVPSYLDGFIDRSVNGYVVVTELVEGMLLSNLIQSRWLYMRYKYRVASQLCRALAFIHSRDILHRNLHSGNVVYKKGELFKIINFEYSRVRDLPTIPDGSPVDPGLYDDWNNHRPYHAPELSNIHLATPATDRYSLGVILWELFTARNVLNDGFDLSLLTQVQNLDPTVISLIEALCSLDPAERLTVDLSQQASQLIDLSHRADLTDRPLPEFEEGRTVLERYRVLRAFPGTIMSHSYAAYDLNTGKQVVIKFLTAYEAQAREEIDTASKLWQEISKVPENCDYVAPYVDGGFVQVQDGRIVSENAPDSYRIGYLVNEFVDGPTLKEVIAAREKSGEEAVALAYSLLDALMVVHNVGYYHGDIKPENLILGTDGKIRIIDFGLSARVGDRQIAAGMSPGYTAPELRSEKAGGAYLQPSAASDIYSAAAVILALLCGEGHGLFSGPMRDWALAAEKAGPEIVKILQRQLSDDPALRCQTVVDLVDEMEKAPKPWEQPEPDPLEELRRQVKEIIDRLTDQAKEDAKAKKYDDVKEKSKAYESLQKWLDGGPTGPCPVDVTQFGFPALPGVEVVAADSGLGEGTQVTQEIRPEDEGARNLDQVKKDKVNADQLINAGEYDKAITLLIDLERRAPEDPEIKELRKRAESGNQYNKIQSLISELLYQEDIQKLVNAENEATRFLGNFLIEQRDTKDLKDLAETLAAGKKRRAEIATDQRKAQTQTLSNEYDEITYGLNEMRKASARGQKTWQVKDAIQDIETQIQIAKDNQTKAAGSSADHVLMNAERQMPAEGPRTPQAALDLLNTVINLDGLSDEKKQKLLEKQKEWTEALERWKLAGAEMEKAAAATDPLTRLQFWHQAESFYKWHHQVMAFRDEYFRAAADFLKTEIAQRINEAERALEAEESQALRRLDLPDGKQDSILPAFEQAQRAVDSAARTAGQVREEYYTPEVRDWLKKLDNFREKLDERRKRREEITRLYILIRGDLRVGNSSTAHDNFMTIPAERQSDGVIKRLAQLVQGTLSDEDNLLRARRALDESNWDDCLDILDHLKNRLYDDGKGLKAEDLRARANLFKLEKEIDDLWQAAHYDRAGQKLSAFENYEVGADLATTKEKIQQDLNVEEKQAELQLRRRTNEEHKVSGRIKDILNTVPELRSDAPSPIEVLGQDGQRLERITAQLDELGALSQLPITRLGEVRAWKARLEASILNKLIQKLEEERSRKSPNLKQAFRYAKVLHQYKLIRTTHEDELCRWAILKHYDQQTETQKQNHQWQPLLRNWWDACRSYPEELEIKERLNSLCRECVQWSFDQALEEMDQSRAEGILAGEGDNPCVVDGAILYKYNVELDDALRLRRDVLRVMQEADHLFAQGNYEHALAHVQQRPEGIPDEAWSRYRNALDRKESQLHQDAVASLRKTGRDQDIQISERIAAWSRLLALDGQDIEATRWMEDKINQVQQEIRDAIQKGQELEITQAHVDVQIESALELAKRLNSLAMACQRYMPAKLKELDQACWRVEGNPADPASVGLLGELEEAQTKLIEYAPRRIGWNQWLREEGKHKELPEGNLWRQELRNAGWDNIRKVINDLSEKLEPIGLPHPQVVELRQSLERAMNDQRDLIQKRDELANVLNSPDEGAVDRMIQLMADIDEILRRNGVAFPYGRVLDQKEPNKERTYDPFFIFTPTKTFYDTFLRKEVLYFETLPRDPQGAVAVLRAPGEETHSTGLHQLYGQRKDNLEKWKKYRDLIKVYEDKHGYFINIERPALSMLEEVEKYLLELLGNDPAILAGELKKLRQLPIQEKPDLPDFPWLPDRPDVPASLPAKTVQEDTASKMKSLMTKFARAYQDWKELDSIYRAKMDDLDQFLSEPTFRPKGNNEDNEMRERVGEFQRFFANSRHSDMIKFLDRLYFISCLPENKQRKRGR